MSTSSASIKPVFSTTEEEPLLSKPISKLAILSLILGVVGMLTPFTRALTLVPIAAILLGLVGSFQLSRANSSSSGAWIANVGLFLGLLSYSWFSIANNAHQERLGRFGGEFASHFLELLADGNVYAAAELQQPVGSRQLAGLDLAAYYESYQGDPEMSPELGSPDPRMLAKMRITELRKHAVTNYVRQYPNAKWEFSKLQRVLYNPSNVQIVVVVLTNSEDEKAKISVALQRQSLEQEGKLTADWLVREMKML